jgi:hypothetical protein
MVYLLLFMGVKLGFSLLAKMKGISEERVEESRLFGPKREELMGGRRKLHIEEHHDSLGLINCTGLQWFHCLKYFMLSLSISAR